MELGAGGVPRYHAKSGVHRADSLTSVLKLYNSGDCQRRLAMELQQATVIERLKPFCSRIVVAGAASRW